MRCPYLDTLCTRTRTPPRIYMLKCMGDGYATCIHYQALLLREKDMEQRNKLSLLEHFKNQKDFEAFRRMGNICPDKE